jgi:hypothetical protein
MPTNPNHALSCIVRATFVVTGCKALGITLIGNLLETILGINGEDVCQVAGDNEFEICRRGN